MKRIVILLLVLLFGTSLISAEDLHAGVSIGGNLAFLSTEGTYDILLADRSARLGLIAGVYGSYDFHSIEDKLELSIQPGIFYAMKGFRVDDLQVNLDYLELPVLIKARLPLNDFEPYLLLGPSFGINVVRKSEIGGFTVSSDTMKNDFGLIVGAGIDFEQDLSFDIRANFGLVNIIESDTRNQNHSVAFMLSYHLM